MTGKGGDFVGEMGFKLKCENSEKTDSLSAIIPSYEKMSISELAKEEI